jgi:hypothetical protein
VKIAARAMGAMAVVLIAILVIVALPALGASGSPIPSAAATLPGVAASSTDPASTDPAPTTVDTISYSRFSMVTDAGQSIAISGPNDCKAVADSWLEDFCTNLAAYNKNILPSSASSMAGLHGKAWADLDRHIQVAVARAVLHGDDTICDNPVVSAWVSAGAHVSDGAATCRVDLAATIKKGSFFVTDPDTNANLTITLSSVQP